MSTPVQDTPPKARPKPRWAERHFLVLLVIWDEFWAFVERCKKRHRERRKGRA